MLDECKAAPSQQPTVPRAWQALGHKLQPYVD